MAEQRGWENYTDARATMKRFMSDCYTGNFIAAAQALDLNKLSTADRREQPRPGADARVRPSAPWVRLFTVAAE